MSEDVSIAVRPSGEDMTVFEQLQRTVPIRVERDELLTLQVAQPLPELCVKHGRDADQWRSIGINFRPGLLGQEQVSVASFARAALWVTITFGYAMGRVLNVSATLEGRWPICRRCRWAALVFRWIGHIFAAVGPLALFVMFAGLQSGASGELFEKLRLVVAPGWFPFSLMVAGAAYLRSATYVRCRPIEDDAPTTVVIRAHPAFADAVADLYTDTSGATTSSEEA
ncbi:hypothetical protein NRB20_25760 [Nocardia sp. RB20]|uniref:Uncharacterized protein n=2 Tax=Nocardia macrotermitis TaxID=2585198 RepID=A0A7K0D178_9NOCA|nr:hypothetical protein [Nocardia macrotermitis]